MDARDVALEEREFTYFLIYGIHSNQSSKDLLATGLPGCECSPASHDFFPVHKAHK